MFNIMIKYIKKIDKIDYELENNLDDLEVEFHFEHN